MTLNKKREETGKGSPVLRFFKGDNISQKWTVALDSAEKALKM